MDTWKQGIHRSGRGIPCGDKVHGVLCYLPVSVLNVGLTTTTSTTLSLAVIVLVYSRVSLPSSHYAESMGGSVRSSTSRQEMENNNNKSPQKQKQKNNHKLGRHRWWCISQDLNWWWSRCCKWGIPQLRQALRLMGAADQVQDQRQRPPGRRKSRKRLSHKVAIHLCCKRTTPLEKKSWQTLHTSKIEMPDYKKNWFVTLRCVWILSNDF